MGLAIAMLLAFVIVVAAVSANLMRLIDSENENDTEIARSSLENRCIRLENIVVKIFPLTAVKIVVVVWQIISQVNMRWVMLLPNNQNIRLCRHKRQNHGDLPLALVCEERNLEKTKLCIRR